jgi:thiol-disulfide isomerase/thioredoxin
VKKGLLVVISLCLMAVLTTSFSACGGGGKDNDNGKAGSHLISKAKAQDVGDWVLPIVENPGDFDMIDEVDIKALLAREDVKVVLIDFWATWCEPCKAAMPHLEEIYQDYKDKGLAAVVITIDVKNSTLERMIKADVAHLGVSYPIPWDFESKVKNAYGIGAIPVTYLVDKEGKIRYEHSGFTSKEIDMPPLIDAIEELLNE